MVNIVFTPKGNKDLAKLPKEIQKRIVKKIAFFSTQENPISYAKPLVNLPPLIHRFRIGNYRIAFYIEDKTIVIDRIEHRKDVYSNQ